MFINPIIYETYSLRSHESESIFSYHHICFVPASQKTNFKTCDVYNLRNLYLFVLCSFVFSINDLTSKIDITRINYKRLVQLIESLHESICELILNC